MLKLPNVTLVIVDTVNYSQALISLANSMSQAEFGRVLFLTDSDVEAEGVDVVKINKIKSKREYSYFIIKQLYKYIETDYVLVTQHDSWVLDGNAWTDEFLNYDYIGAKWLYVDGRNVGNGGFSLRSKKLQEILGTDPFIQITHHEDDCIGRLYRNYLEHNGIIFAPEDVADQFSFELNPPKQPTFGFHGYFHEPYKEIVVVKRMGAMGDVITVEPVLEHLHLQGYRVALETQPYFMDLFREHYFPILDYNKLDKSIDYKKFDLDMSYEIMPYQNHLKTYFQFCGIKADISNPKLVSKGKRIIENKYVIIHIENRVQAYRNIYGIDWEWVVHNLNNLGYEVLQLGLSEHETVKGAIKFNVPNLQVMKQIVNWADLFIGIDSGISHIASALEIPSIIFFGSVNPTHVHVSLENKLIIHNHDKKVCETPFCWSNSVGCEGTKCYIDNNNPPCTKYEGVKLVDEIKKILVK